MPTFKKYTINIGNRQNGRLKADSIIDVLPNKILIRQAINKIYKTKLNKKKINNPPKKLDTSKEIFSIIKNINLKKYRTKKFYDILS